MRGSPFAASFPYSACRGDAMARTAHEWGRRPRRRHSAANAAGQSGVSTPWGGVLVTWLEP
jgi:hypothetical protein